MVTPAVRPCPDDAGVAEELNRHKSSRVVRTYWAQNDECFGLSHFANAEFVVHADGGGPDVKRVLRFVRDPVFFDLDQLAAALCVLVHVKCWQAQLLMRVEHALEVFVDAEHCDSVVHSSVSFGTFEAFDSIVERGIGWVQMEGCIWDYLGSLPAAIVFVVVDI